MQGESPKCSYLKQNSSFTLIKCASSLLKCSFDSAVSEGGQREKLLLPAPPAMPVAQSHENYIQLGETSHQEANERTWFPNVEDAVGALYILSALTTTHHDHVDGFPFKPWRLQLRAFPGCGGVLRSAGDLRPPGIVSALIEMRDRRSWWINNPASLLLEWDTFRSSEGPRQDWAWVAHSSFVHFPSFLHFPTGASWKYLPSKLPPPQSLVQVLLLEDSNLKPHPCGKSPFLHPLVSVMGWLLSYKPQLRLQNPLVIVMAMVSHHIPSLIILPIIPLLPDLQLIHHHINFPLKMFL